MKYLVNFFFLSLLFLFSSCGDKNHESVSRFYEDGRAKPVIAIVPLIDSTTYDIPWSLSDELTTLIREEFSKKKTIYLVPADNLDNHLTFTKNPFGSDISWVKEAFDPYEFVVFFELVKHENKPTDPLIERNQTSLQEIPYSLTSAIRIRIIDLRNKTALIVLQQLFEDSFVLAKSFSQPDYNEITWGKKEYTATALYTAHRQLAKQMIERVEDYILLAKSR